MNATDLKKTYGYSVIGEQLKKIQASDATAGDRFGWSVAANDTKIVVGAPYEDTGGNNAGSVYIFDIDGIQIRKIQASNAGSGDYFGRSVACSDTRIVVGAPYEDTGGSNAGSAYIFDIYGNQLAMINASNAGSNDNFGYAVACSDTRIVVGAPDEDTGGSNAGSAYVFDIDGNQLAKINASNRGSGDEFGYSVAISNNRILVGAPYEDSGGSNAGSAYIFDMNGNQLAKINASDDTATDFFGYAVACSDTRIVVGAPLEDTGGQSAGSAYVFDIDGNQLTKIQASDAAGYDQFGTAVAVYDTRIVVGAPYKNRSGFPNAGSAYVFDIYGNQLAKIQASDAGSNDLFSYAVAVSDTRIVVGARDEDTGGADTGSAYIFSPGFSPFGDLCAYYDLGDPTALDTTFSWNDYK